jgi:hypothetical protein
MGDILPGGSVRDPGGRLTLDWLAVYRECARYVFSENDVPEPPTRIRTAIMLSASVQKPEREYAAVCCSCF